MKKIIAFALILVLALSVTACGAKQAVQDAIQGVLNGTETDATDGGDTTADGGSAAAGGDAVGSLIDWMRGGTFSYDFALTTEYDGQTTEATGSMAMDGGNCSITMVQGAGGGVESRILIIEGEVYVIDDTNKMIIKMSGAGPELTGGMPTDYVDMEIVGTGEGTVNGRVLPYEEYSVEGASVKYYMDGRMVYAIESTYEGVYSLMIISNARNTVPAGAFDLPEGYMEMSL